MIISIIIYDDKTDIPNRIFKWIRMKILIYVFRLRCILNKHICNILAINQSCLRPQIYYIDRHSISQTTVPDNSIECNFAIQTTKYYIIYKNISTNPKINKCLQLTLLILQIMINKTRTDSFHGKNIHVKY